MDCNVANVIYVCKDQFFWLTIAPTGFFIAHQVRAGGALREHHRGAGVTPPPAPSIVSEWQVLYWILLKWVLCVPDDPCYLTRLVPVACMHVR